MIAIGLLFGLVLVLYPGCRGSQSTRPPATGHAHPHDTLTGPDRLDAKRGPRLQSVRTEPDMRIRIAQSQSSATLGEVGMITVGPGQRETVPTRPRTFQAPLRVTHDRQGFVLTQPDGSSVRWRLNSLSFAGSGGRTAINQHPYPGSIVLHAGTDQSGNPTGVFDAVNHVAMESYLPGVLSKELYPGWDEEAYKAQAIAARSYAIWEMRLPNRRTRHWDLEASTASQAYIGDKASTKARAAVAATRGQVLVYDGRVLPAFYSSCTGGVGQDAVVAWPGKVDDLPPLRGRVHGGWGQISNRYRWGPVRVPAPRLYAAIIRWGQANEHPVAGMQSGLRAIQPTATNSVGRPTKFTITDASGRRFDIDAEDLRMATNYPVPGDPPGSDYKTYSSNASYTFAGNTVSITGKGFGHGVGMCQWGAQHMATQGNNHRQILGFYYQGAAVVGAY